MSLDERLRKINSTLDNVNTSLNDILIDIARSARPEEDSQVTGLPRRVNAASSRIGARLPVSSEKL